MNNTKIWISISCLLFHVACFSQSSDTNSKKFWKNLYTPSIEIGYINIKSKNLSNSFLFKTSIEYRFSKKIFGRIGYDTYTSKYNLSKIPNISNVVNGSVNFNDVTIGFGYRIGNKQIRFFALPQFGINFYEFPIAEQNFNTISLNLKSKQVYLSKVTTGFEYYLDDKKIIKLEGTYGQMLKKQDFWNDKSGSLAISIGYITSFF